MVFNENDTPEFYRIVDIADEVKTPDALYGIWKFSGSAITDNKLISFNKDNSYIEFSLGGSHSTDALFYEKGIYEINDATAATPATLSVVKVTETMDSERGISNETKPRFSIDGNGVMSLTVYDSLTANDLTVTLTKITGA